MVLLGAYINTRRVICCACTVVVADVVTHTSTLRCPCSSAFSLIYFRRPNLAVPLANLLALHDVRGAKIDYYVLPRWFRTRWQLFQPTRRV